MIGILVRQPSARLRYVLKLLFEHVLPTPYRIIQKMDESLGLVLNYTGEAVENTYFIPNIGFADTIIMLMVTG